MKNNNLLLVFLIATSLLSCAKHEYKTIKFKVSKETTINVNDKLKEVDNKLILDFGEMHIIDSLFIYIDFATFLGEKSIHIFNNKDFSHIKSFGTIGQGPDEIIRVGSASYEEKNKNLWIYDYGREVRWCFNLDSMIMEKNYFPTIKKEMNHDIMLVESKFLNDSTLIGTAIIPLSANSMEMTTAIENINTSEIKNYGYRYIKSKDRYDTYSSFNLSLKKGLYANAYKNVDCLSLCDLNGELVYNFIGEHINKSGDEYKLYNYFNEVAFYKNYIISSYTGSPRVLFHDSGDEMVSPSKLLVFSIDGKFLNTLDIGEGFTSFCVNEMQDRIIFSFEGRENMFGYLDLKEVI